MNDGSLSAGKIDETLQAVFDAMREGIIVADAETREFVYTNSAMCRMLGYSEKELLALTPADLHPPDLASFVEARFAAVVAREIEAVNGIPMLRKDGATFSSDISASPVTIHGRDCIIGVITDITGREEAEQKLRESEEYLRLALFASGQGTWDHDVEAGTTVVSAEFASMLGYEHAGFHENMSSISQRLHPQDRERVFAAYEAYLRGDLPRYQEEFRLRTSSGAWKWILSTGMIVGRDAEGRPLRMIGTHIDIDWRKEAEAKLRESEERYRRLHDSMADAFVEVDMTGRIVDSNRAYRDMLGYTAEELSQLTSVDLTPEGWHDFEARIVAEQILPLERSDVYEKEYRRKDGAVFPVELRTFLLKDRSGAAAGMWAIVRDISERQRLVRELVIKEQAMASAISGIAMAGMDAKLIYANEAWLRMHGYDAAGQVLGTTFSGHLADSAEVTAALDIYRAQGWWSGELLRRRRDGSLFPAAVAANMVFNAAGEPICMMASCQDITERKRAEELVRDSEARLREAQQIAQVGSWELDLVENRLLWSDEVFRIFEIDKEAFGAAYEAFLKLVHPEDRENVDTAYRRSLEVREPYEITHRLVMQDGRVKHVRERGRSDYGVDGQPVRSVGTVQDITALQDAEGRIRAQLREKEVLLREIHHRVKNNLQIVSSLLHLQSAASKDPGVVKLFEDSRRRVNTMASVHDILYQSPDLDRVAIPSYIEKLVSALRATHAQLGPDIQVVTQVSVPYLDLQCAVPCGLIVSELTTNAFKYAFERREKGTILILLRETAPGQLRLTVQDDGCGMPKDTSGATEGFGLHLVRLLAGQIGGSLEISSGPGTELSVTFPARR
jgi:PAS domain S-box-containing protein